VLIKHIFDYPNDVFRVETSCVGDDLAEVVMVRGLKLIFDDDVIA
jgi:hypothetical protein